jgi:DNA primase
MDTILNFRRLLIEEKIAAVLASMTPDIHPDEVAEKLTVIHEYNKLRQHLGKRLNRVV